MKKKSTQNRIQTETSNRSNASIGSVTTDPTSEKHNRASKTEQQAIARANRAKSRSREMSPSQTQPTSNFTSGQPTNATSNNMNDELRAPRSTELAVGQGGNGESQNKESADITTTASSNVGGRTADPPNRRSTFFR
ncbi:uncharacterized protein MELLADRAFT_85679 [Melampsora larici-populina 98AG31]|uniref:Uncharacterized protein n=1 Tax=Melampsora larici-populina (strain 98AG31 / pathotype 3-4-7) TaxID=747676 RepID=F4RJE1_MELLP|nr:uncharacterized protein MELLADRAFT_85679 [Melampsora larici-populina 98AG31]EGG07513.1 hypothetical protein MELLADRAFT_85679 [Melampsora larici-populina 98AG31]